MYILEHVFMSSSLAVINQRTSVRAEILIHIFSFTFQIYVNQVSLYLLPPQSAVRSALHVLKAGGLHRKHLYLCDSLPSKVIN